MSKETSASREAEILLWCARRQRQPPEEAAASAHVLLQSPVDWDSLLQLALRHKVMPLLYGRLNTVSAQVVPTEFMERLRDYFYLNAARNHLFMEELCGILQLFETGGVRCVPYKGPILATALYGDVALRQFNDLDIMVRREDVTKASRLLRAEGFHEEHELTKAETASLLKVECEHMFFRPRGKIYLDLHWGFTPNYFPFKLDTESIWKRLTPIAVGKRQAHSFSPEDLVLILSVNAGKEFWSHLGGLCDIAALIRTYPGLDWERLVGEAKRAGIRRMLFVSLKLSHEMIGANLPEEILHSIAAETEVRSLALTVRRELFRREEGKARGVSQFLKPAKALDGRRAQAKFHLRLALTPTPEDWTFIRLPESLRFLHYLTRPFRLAGKYLFHQRKPGHLG